MNEATKCTVCGTEMIQKSRARLLAVGFCFLALAGLAAAFRVLWVPGAIAALASAYLITWATAGKGRWCRQCKTFRIPAKSNTQ